MLVIKCLLKNNIDSDLTNDLLNNSFNLNLKKSSFQKNTIFHYISTIISITIKFESPKFNIYPIHFISNLKKYLDSQGFYCLLNFFRHDLININTKKNLSFYYFQLN